MHGAEDPRPDPLAQQAHHGDDGQQVDGQGAQAQPERPVGAEEREDQVDQAQLGERVEEQAAHVHGDQADTGERRGPVHVGHAEAAQAAHRPAGAGR